MWLRRLHHNKPGPPQQHSRLDRHFLAVLEAASRMISNCEVRPRAYRRILYPHQKFTDVACQGSDPVSPATPRLRLRTEQEAIVLDCRSAARRIDDDGVKPSTFNLSAPRRDIGTRTGHSCGMFPHVVRQGTATT